ncbi:sigma-70 family RNA polymerase sigma factor [Acidimicrobiia bacterium EGI L10123]|uniref:sigma-70 family RNA polymerase sigma factor n=1 Tax=Salinilacustrithrix flava TaxID=2957203 RepID=UPI003D7C345C|nr:sigma-70 family RNA polymerase sigma factor [Acidimicrobiia bacterium EGI L10123]
MKDSVGQYLHEIGQVPLLDAARERELAQRIEAGRAARERLDAGEVDVELKRAARLGARAKDEFIRANLRLVVSLAKRYPLPTGMELLDLIQEGNLGLEHAVDKFDWRKGFKFSTYATFWIRQSIGRALDQKSSLIRLPGDRSAQLRAAVRAADANDVELDADLAELQRLTSPTSLDKPLGDAGDGDFGDLIAGDEQGPEAAAVQQLHQQLVLTLLDELSPRSRTAVRLRLGLADGRERSFREVGEELGVTAEAARRLVKRALDELRDAARELELAA